MPIVPVPLAHRRPPRARARLRQRYRDTALSRLVLECPEDANEDDHDAQHSKSDRVEQCWTERSPIERTQAPARFFCVEFVSVDHTESTRRDRRLLRRLDSRNHFVLTLF